MACGVNSLPAVAVRYIFIIGFERFPKKGRCRQDYSRPRRSCRAQPTRSRKLRSYNYRGRLSPRAVGVCPVVASADTAPSSSCYPRIDHLSRSHIPHLSHIYNDSLTWKRLCEFPPSNQYSSLKIQPWPVRNPSNGSASKSYTLQGPTPK